MVIVTLHATQRLANRIKQAYLRRCPWWRPEPSHARVWTIAAVVLVETHRHNSILPIDPELFVASQPLAQGIADPWGDLTCEAAVRRYRMRVFKIIRALRAELRAEIQRLERRLQCGEPVDRVLSHQSRSISPLGRYITAYRAGRLDWAERWRTEASRQHDSCPLYQPAASKLLPISAYPSCACPSEIEPPRGVRLSLPSLN